MLQVPGVLWGPEAGVLGASAPAALQLRVQGRGDRGSGSNEIADQQFIYVQQALVLTERVL
jgi:hypothetical protein